MRKTVLFLILWLWSCTIVIVKAQSTTVNRQNIIIILADDLGYGDLGCFGSTVIKTPNLDQLAQEGVRLTQFYSGSTVCAPSRAALMTGKHTGTGYIRGNGEFPLRQEDVTLPEKLKSIGYATALFGKWGLGDINTTGSPELQGWDYFTGLLHHVEAHYQFPSIAWSSTPESPVPTRRGTRKFWGFGCDFYTEEAVNWISSRPKEQPFLMMLSLTVPHAELYAPKEAFTQYLGADGKSIFEEKPYEGGHYGNQNQPRAAYAAMVSRLDDYVGMIMETLKAKGLSDNTLIFFSSDNGTHIEGGRGMEDVVFMQSSGKLRGVKRDLYEGGIRVPTIVWGAGLPKGKIVDTHGAFWDILPTFLEVAGTTPDEKTDGVSLWKSWQNNQPLALRPLYWEFYENGFAQAVRYGDWKYIYSQPKNKPTSVELYNLKDDLGETTNLAAKHPTTLKQLQDFAQQMHQKALIPNFQRQEE